VPAPSNYSQPEVDKQVLFLIMSFLEVTKVLCSRSQQVVTTHNILSDSGVLISIAIEAFSITSTKSYMDYLWWVWKYFLSLSSNFIG
jgi:hypothetical protein